jgi:hypothetical protein
MAAMSGERIEWGFAASEDRFWCAKRVCVAGYMLCGQRKGWMPPVPDGFEPPQLCPVCRERLESGVFEPPPDEQAEGTCPVCVGRAPLDGSGLITKHDQWSWSGGRLVVTDQACPGVGERPEYET